MLTMQDVKRNNPIYFSKDTMKFWNSRVESTLLKQRYFITSEKNFDGTKRLYSVREYNSETKEINTVGDFQQFKTKEDAKEYIKNL